MEAAFAHFPNFAKKLLSNACADPRPWQLFDMDSIPHYVKDRAALIGDAAHPFLPCKLSLVYALSLCVLFDTDATLGLGQGGAQAIEDAISIGTILQPDTKPEEVPDLLELYECIRKPRADYVQSQTRRMGLDEDKGRPQRKSIPVPQGIMRKC